MSEHVLVGPFSPSKLPCHVWGSGPLSNTCLLRLTQVHIPKGISIDSAIFARLKVVTDRQTDHAALSVAIGCIIASAAIRPNYVKN